MNSKSKYTALRIPLEVSAKLEMLSAASGLPVSQIILSCITRALPYVDSKIAAQLDTPHTSITGDIPVPTIPAHAGTEAPNERRIHAEA